MNKKNIILFSIATTLLLANCAEGMDKKKETLNQENKYEASYTPKTKVKTLTSLEKSRNMLVTITCTGDITTNDLNELIDTLSKESHTIEYLILKHCPKISFKLVKFDKVKNLKRLHLMGQDLQGVDIPNALLKHNKQNLLLFRADGCKNVSIQGIHKFTLKPNFVVV